MTTYVCAACGAYCYEAAGLRHPHDRPGGGECREPMWIVQSEAEAEPKTETQTWRDRPPLL